MTITLPSMKELFTGELAINGNWVVANLDTAIPWPTKVVKVSFRFDEIVSSYTVLYRARCSVP